MRSASKLLSPPSLPRLTAAGFLLSRGKSSRRRPHSADPPSLYQMITKIVPYTPDTDQQSNKSTQDVCQNVRSTNSTSQTIETGKIQLQAPDLEEISAVVHKVTEIIRSDNVQIPMEQRLKELGIAFTPEIVERVLKRCFKVGNLAFRFFSWMKLQPGFCHTTETYNTMAYIAGDAGEFDLVEKLMEDMDSDLCSKNIKTWTILISQYANSKKIGKALWTFEEMRKSGCKLDSGVYEAILRGLFSARKAELAFEFYKEMVLKKMKVDIKIYAMLMDCLSIAGDIGIARLVAEDMMKIAELPETEVLTILLRSFCISGKVDEAQELFEEMRSRDISVDSNVCEVLVKGLCRAGRTDEAMEIVDEMKHSLNASNRIYGCLIDGFLRKGRTLKALKLLHGMKELGFLPLVSSYTQVIQHLFRSDQYGKACEIYEEMLENGIEADIVATTAVVAGHVQHNNISEAWKVFNDMKRKGMVPTWKAYSVFIKELCKASKPNEAFKLLSEMSARKINPTEHIFRLVISSLTRNGQVEKARIAEQQCRSFRLDHREDEKLCHSAEHHQTFHEDHEVSFYCSDENLVCGQTQNTFDENDVEELCRILSSSTNSDLLLQTLDRSSITFTPELVEAVLRRSQRHGCAALQFFSWVGKQPNYSHTTETYNMAIKIAGSGKDFKHMRNLYQEMRRRRCSIEPNTWTIMISQYGQAGLTEIAFNTFKEMKAEGYQPNGATFKYLIIFLCGKKGRKVEEAINIFQEILPSRFMPDKEMVGIFLSSLCESKKFAEARRAVKSLCKEALKARSVTLCSSSLYAEQDKLKKPLF